MHADRPARFRDVFASGEFRALYAGSVLSWVGDYAARAAVTAMVYEHTGSPAASAAAFAVSFAPWLLGGSLLVAVAERYPYRTVMVWCDLARTAGMAVLAVVGAALGLPTLFALLLLCALFAPPFDAARSATMPQILGRDRYVGGVSLTLATAPPAQVIGYVGGAAISAIEPRLALALNAVTFILSALLVRFGVQWRAPALRPERRSGLLRETGDGFRLVFTNPARRALVLLVFAASLFAVVPEGLGAVWADHRADGLGRAWAQGMIMGAVPAGMVLGALGAAFHWRIRKILAYNVIISAGFIAFGIGAQAPVKGKIELSDETKTVLRMMADSTTSVGVRGAYSAQVLWDIGIRNVRIVGCPTAFRRNDPNLTITLPPLETVKYVGVTMRREVSPAYAQDIKRYLTFHRDLVKSLAERFDVVLMAQGEVEEKKIVFGTPEQKEEAFAALRANKWVSEWYLDEVMEKLHRERLFYSDVVADYEALVQQKDVVLGYRLHGNLMALSNGTPSIYFTYDSRTVEFAETFQIPSFDVFSGKDFVLEEYWDQSLFDKFNRAYHHTYREMRQFLVENGADTKMVDVMQKAPEPARKVA